MSNLNETENLNITVHIDFNDVKPEKGVTSVEIVSNEKKDNKYFPGDKVAIIFDKVKEEANISGFWIDLTCEGELLNAGEYVCNTNLENGSTVMVKYNDKYEFASDMKLMGELDWIDFSAPFQTTKPEKELIRKIISNIEKDPELYMKKLTLLMQLGADPNCKIDE